MDVWWSETDDETRAAATALGFDEHKWNDDWEIKDLEVEHLYWKDLTDEQKDAAIHFGYSRALWDETDEDDDAEFAAAVSLVLLSMIVVVDAWLIGYSLTPFCTRHCNDRPLPSSLPRSSLPSLSKKKRRKRVTTRVKIRKVLLPSPLE